MPKRPNYGSAFVRLHTRPSTIGQSWQDKRLGALLSDAEAQRLRVALLGSLGTCVDVWAGFRFWLRQRFDERWWVHGSTGELLRERECPGPGWEPFDWRGGRP